MWRDAERPKVVDEEVDFNKSDDSGQENQSAGTDGARDSSRVPPSASPPPRPTAARRIITLADEDDIWADMDDAIVDVEMVSTATAVQVKQKPVPRSNADDDDLEDWFNADNEPHVPSKGPPVPEPPGEMDIDEPPNVQPNPKRYLSPPRADNWDEDLFD
jgi:hypothetical protein